jgi:hypothetical protein
VDRYIEILNSVLETATFSSLASVEDDVLIVSNPFLSAANFSTLLAIPGDLYIANNMQLQSASFMRVTRIDGSLSLIKNNLLTSVVLSALTAILGQLMLSNNPQLLPLVTKLSCQSCALNTAACSGFTDALSCSVILGDRFIIESSVTSLTNPALTRAVGWLDIQGNNDLTRIDFASLSYVGGYLNIANLRALTLASLPLLSQVQSYINFCQNNNAFLIPSPASGTAAWPGLTSVIYKGQPNCFLQHGSNSCGFSRVTCP